jgi:hypothetical protein
LERGVFRFPSAMHPGDTSVSIEAAEFAKILEGLDLGRATKVIGITHRKGVGAEESTSAT